MKTNESTRQLQKGLIRLTELFPPNQEATPAIEPRKQAFDDPSTRCFAWFQAIDALLWRPIPLVVVSIETHMRLVAPFVQLAIDGIMIVSSIQAQMLRSLNRWFWTLAHPAGHQGWETATCYHGGLAPSMHRAKGSP